MIVQNMSEEKNHLGNRDSRSIEMPTILNILQGCITIRSQTLDKGGVKGGNKYIQKLLPPH